MASWYWNENSYLIKESDDPYKGNANELIDGTFFNFSMITHALTTDVTNLKERVLFNDLVLNELKYPSLKTGRGLNIGFN